MEAPTFWQGYFIAGALHSLFIVGRAGFKQRYREFAAKSLHKISHRARLITACIAMAFCVLIWPAFIAIGVLVLIVSLIAGMRSGWRR